MRKSIQQEIIWRGSITDLATDVAYLLNKEDGKKLIDELNRFQNESHLADKWQDKGFEEV